ncbi:ABC transporter permease [Bradyrhizobium sp. UFLA05-112]
MTITIKDPLLQRYQAIGASLATMVYFVIMAPIVVIIPMAFGSVTALTFPPESYSLELFKIFFTSPSWQNPLIESVKVAIASMAVAMLAGVPAGYWIIRHEFVGKWLITGIIMSPLIIPAIVSALGLYLYFSYFRIASTTYALVLGHVMYTLPYVILMIGAGVQKLDRNLEFGAELMGAGPVRMFFAVVLPQLVPSLVASALFAFLLSFDEVVIAWFLAGGTDHMTLPVRMYSAIEYEVSPVLAAVSTLLTLLSLLISIVAISLQKFTPNDGG